MVSGKLIVDSALEKVEVKNEGNIVVDLCFQDIEITLVLEKEEFYELYEKIRDMQEEIGGD